ncbi:Multidrug resistance protein MdtC [Paraburkholderia kirstenboschensis]|nr:Multidrug resistance protein MdtC [Paraburkholderia kirstenboschensis]
MAAMTGQLDIARQTLENNRVLVEKGLISKNAFDTAQSQYEIARANLLPLAAALGEGGEQRGPLGQTVIGGVITSSLLTLVVVPVVYTMLEDWADWVRRKLRRRAG